MPLLSAVLLSGLAAPSALPQEDPPASTTPFPSAFERASADGQLRVRVSESIIGFNDPAMNQESFVTSADGHRVAYMVMVGQGISVTVDGETGESFEGIARDSILFSPGGEHVAYVGTRPGKQYVVLDGILHEYDGVSRQGIVFSSDGQRYGWVAERDGNQLAVIDDQESPPYEGIAPSGILFSPDGKRTAYVAYSGGQHLAVVDGEEGPLFDLVTGLRFSPDSVAVAYVGVRGKEWFVVSGLDVLGPYQGVTSMTLDSATAADFEAIVFPASGSRVGFLATRQGQHYAVVDGKEAGPYKGCSKLTFSPDGSRVAFLASEGEGWFLVLDGEERRGAAYQGLFFSPDGKRCAVVLRRGDRELVSIDGQESAEHHRIESVAFSADGSRVAYVATDGVDKTVVLDGKESAPLKRFGRIPLSFIAGSQKAVWSYRKAGGEVLVVDGQEGPPARGFRSLAFSDDGQHYAYASQRRNDSWTAVIDGVEYGPEGRIEGPDDPTWTLVGKQTPIFSPDGERWAYSAARNGRFVVVSGDWTSADYDLVMKGTVSFTPDSKHLLFIGARGDENTGQRCIVVDGLEIENGWHGFLQNSSFRFHSPTRFCMRALRNPRNLLVELEILDQG